VPQPANLDGAGTAVAAQPDRDQRQAFCAKLRFARERRGIPLPDIATATKIGVSHLAELERNDLRRWPAGIYRRAWIRSYAAAVGLPVESTVEEFLAVFEPTPSPATDTASGVRSPVRDPGEAAQLRLTLAEARGPARLPFRHLRAHVLEAALALILAVIVAWSTNGGVLVATGVLALCAFAPIVAAVKRVTQRRLRT
jgi:transcriptional regulator with XRE-family HTH domain